MRALTGLSGSNRTGPAGAGRRDVTTTGGYQQYGGWLVSDDATRMKTAKSRYRSGIRPVASTVRLSRSLTPGMPSRWDATEADCHRTASTVDAGPGSGRGAVAARVTAAHAASS